MSPSGLLSTRGLTRRFGGIRAVDGLDLDVEAGSITGLIGPNGAGKSTAFHLVAGLLRPDAGEIWFDGRRIDGLPAHERARRGLVRSFQVPRELAALSVLDNLLVAAPARRGERLLPAIVSLGRVLAEEAPHRRRAEAILELTGLASHADAPAGRLSGGQKKLLELARTLMAGPRLALLDEPGAGVNPALMARIVETIRARNQEGTTFLVIEHDMDLVMSLCHRVIVMAEGRVIAAGTPDEVQRDPLVLDAYLGGPA
ncbi:MAG TPA: ABC transporter ATP-binding protein [Thermodesulfobacteriota bacterium]